jgi:hypothetical protein
VPENRCALTCINAAPFRTGYADGVQRRIAMVHGTVHGIRIHNHSEALNGRVWWCGDRRAIPGLQTDSWGTDCPFSVPAFVGPQFAALRGYWNSLKRGQATIPFADDFKPAVLGKLGDSIALIGIFQNPQRFRFDLIGSSVAACYGGELQDYFVDRVAARIPLHYLLSQCSATIERAAPTFYYGACADGSAEYQRLMLPLWGDARISAILTSFELGHTGSGIA